MPSLSGAEQEGSTSKIISRKTKTHFASINEAVENKVLIEFNIPFLHLLLNKHSYPQQMLTSSTRYAIQISSIKIYYIHPTKPIQYRNKHFPHQQENSLMFSIPPIRSLLFLELKLSFHWQQTKSFPLSDIVIHSFFLLPFSPLHFLKNFYKFTIIFNKNLKSFAFSFNCNL